MENIMYLFAGASFSAKIYIEFRYFNKFLAMWFFKFCFYKMIVATTKMQTGKANSTKEESLYRFNVLAFSKRKMIYLYFEFNFRISMITLLLLNYFTVKIETRFLN